VNLRSKEAVMPYKIIKGHFHVVGYSPDGDSIRFQAIDKSNWDYFTWKTPADKNSARKQLRFEAIDAVETHYEESHQPRAFGLAALEVLLELLGIRDVIFNLSLTQVHSAADNTNGFIATQGLDIYDRPISLVFAGAAPFNDGAEVSLSALPMSDCVNLKLAKLGLVYPTFYSTMENDLLDLFTATTKEARANRVGLWALDKTSRFTLWNTSTIRDDVVILPKLFRRLTTFFQDRSDYAELADYLKQKSDKVMIRSTGQKADLADLLSIRGQTIEFSTQPEELIFAPKN
jgi:endonuclease YncB( thermonuclease family)